ncbi:SDR family oxidoreductase [Pandoraea sp. XJJ-1]|uniref:SDR family NAD(P)-dependent oxidoreductase n=1 Tax=Burkholderiaceae TaxID=119060 RepID=UPI001FF72E92|nr:MULTISPECIES: SDR family oxidoreductase [Burkholderiaceae]MDC6282738.1 SDR family oxidoreductase [Ralstonia pseudosolanacearum]WAL81570.1 SDR family oxidoreductase [Pandoraea sp. XJJ-1]
MSTSNLKKVAVVTGASSGIGAGYADRLARRGYDLVLVARRTDRLKTLSEQLTRTHGVKVELITADLTNPADLARVEQELANNPAIQVLVNNAGLARLRPLADAPVEDSLSQIALNITALVRLTHVVLPAFKSRGQGAIINIASVLALHALPVSSVYSGTKGFVLNFSRGLQQELEGTGVRVQVVLPASTATEIWDQSGIPLAALDQQAVMTTDNLVDAALAGFDQGELVTLPSLHDAAQWENYDAARGTVFGATQTSKPAPRYKAA